MEGRARSAARTALTTHRRSIIVLLLTLAVLRSRILEMPKNTLDKLRAVASRKSLSMEELSEALQQLYVTEPNGDKTLLVPSRDRVSKVRWPPSLPSFHTHPHSGHHPRDPRLQVCLRCQALPPPPSIHEAEAQHQRRVPPPAPRHRPPHRHALPALQRGPHHLNALLLPPHAHLPQRPRRQARRRHRERPGEFAPAPVGTSY